MPSSKNIQKLEINIEGTIQGVGFRPSVFLLAKSLDLRGRIKNHNHKVHMILEGDREKLNEFLILLPKKIPTQAKIEKLHKTWQKASGLEDLIIVKSTSDGSWKHLATPADLKVCQDCMNEFFNPKDRRYLYPFTACTHCGPRYSITKEFPYNRGNTSMADFPFCLTCEKEYLDIHSRRFHAENSACPDCGPRLSLHNNHGDKFDKLEGHELSIKLVSILKEGKILAIKGLGGYQLVCNAENIDAIKTLRQRKNRPHQALAVMVRNKFLLPEDLRTLVDSPEGPIVIDQIQTDLDLNSLAPDTQSLGVFLPTTPIHHLLFGNNILSDPLNYLVVTSGNTHGEPMYFQNDEAQIGLKSVADYFLHHNREIQRPIDDSVIIKDSTSQVFRRARGLTPHKFNLPFKTPPSVALGGDLKNCFCISKGSYGLMSPHMGDLYKAASYKNFERNFIDFLEFTKTTPEYVVADKHPGYLSNQFAKTYSEKNKIPLIEVQHHLAHSVSVMVENNLSKAISLCFDGTGYGDDGMLWGGECFAIDLPKKYYKRTATLTPSVLLGGEKAILNPKRQSYARLRESGINIKDESDLDKLFERKHLFGQTSSIGRLFDSVSALLIPKYETISYEAQAAIGLETLARKSSIKRTYSINWKDDSIDARHLFFQIYEDFKAGKAIEDIAMGFHWSVSQIALEMAKKSRESFNTDVVTLSGGVFQNQILLHQVRNLFSKEHFKLFEPIKLPAGDGGLALGQLVWGGLIHA